MRKQGKFAVSLVLAALLLSGCTAQVDEPVRRYRLASSQSATYVTNQACQRFCDLVEQASDGSIVIEPFFDNGLGSDDEALEQCTYGGVDFVRTTISAAAQYAPQLTALQMPYLYDSDEHLFRALDGAVGQQALDSLAPVGLTGLTYFHAGYRCFFTVDQPISSLDDMRGLRLGTEALSEMDLLVEQWGAIAVPLTREQFALALRAGQIDGAEDNLPTYVDSGYYKLAPYWTYDRHTYNADVLIASSSTWDDFSEEERAMLCDCASKAASWQRDHWLDAEVRAMLHASRSGCYMGLLDETQIAHFRAAAQPLYDQLTPEQQRVVEEVGNLADEVE